MDHGKAVPRSGGVDAGARHELRQQYARYPCQGDHYLSCFTKGRPAR